MATERRGQVESRIDRMDDAVERVACTVVRGGTSNAVFLDPADLPSDRAERDRAILSLMGSPDRYGKQLDGLGAGTSWTSKVALVEPAPSADDVDVLYSFGQVMVDAAEIDYDSNCGNISSAVGVYAIQEGFVEPTEPVTEVHILDPTTDTSIVNYVPIEDGAVQSVGEYSISGVPGTGARIDVGFRDAGGEITGSVLPTGAPRDEITIGSRDVPCSLVDAGNLFLYVDGSDLGFDGSELEAGFADRQATLNDLREAGLELVERAGVVEDREVARDTLALYPKPVLVNRPTGYEAAGNMVHRADVAMNVRMVSVLSTGVHPAFMGTGVLALGAAYQIPETIVDDLADPTARDAGKVHLPLGHPSGIMDCIVTADDAAELGEVVVPRTARRLIDGTAYYCVEDRAD